MPRRARDRFVAALTQLGTDAAEQLARDVAIVQRYGTRAAVDARCREDPYAFAQTFFADYLIDKATGRPFDPALFHAELYRLATNVVLNREEFAPDAPDRRAGAAAAAPRGHGKSAIISLFIVVWALCYRHKQYIVILSDTGDQAELIGSNIRREFEDNEVLRFYFGDMTGLRHGRKWTLKDFVVVHEDDRGRTSWTGRVKVSGTGSNTRGIRDRENRPDLIIGDDLENDEHVESEDMRDWLYGTWWSKAVLPMLDPRYGGVIVVGTILHHDSLLSRLLKEDDVYVTRRWTCWASSIDPDAGELTPVWAARFSYVYLRSLQRRNPVAFAQEYENDPNPADIRAFRPEDIRFYFGHELRREQSGLWTFRGQALDVYVGVDPAISQEEDAHDFAAIVIGVTRDRLTIVVMQAILDRLDFGQQVDKLVAVGEFYDATVGIEAQAYQRALAHQTRKEIRKSVSIKQLKHHSVGKNGKRRRIMALAPLVKRGRIWFRQATEQERGRPDQLSRLHVHEDHYKLYEQLMLYPRGVRDDGPDGLATAVETAGNVPLFSDQRWNDPNDVPPAIRQGLARAEHHQRVGLADFTALQEQAVLGPRTPKRDAAPRPRRR